MSNSKTNVTAQWRLELLADCPHCGMRDVNLLSDGDFWHDHKEIEPCQNVKSVNVVCPKCGDAFACSLEY